MLSSKEELFLADKIEKFVAKRCDKEITTSRGRIYILNVPCAKI